VIKIGKNEMKALMWTIERNRDLSVEERDESTDVDNREEQGSISGGTR
jgi:hypothetical protein